tara:strand:+ start:480 stop:1178 length:699 start_codon:yes stop_codon:yes gene_type:complete
LANPLFVAEIGVNHDGNFNLVYEMIRRAKAAGADVAKFQFGWRDKPDEINCITPERAIALRKWCDFHEIELLASIIKPEALPLAEAAGLSRFKVASRTVIDHPDLVQRLIDSGKETFVSLGMWTGEDWPFGPPGGNLRYIFCRSRYPSFPEDLVGFPERYGEDTYFGYSCHYQGSAAALMAIARGAHFIEKHFTLNKASQVVKDHALSATPEEFAEMVRLGREIARLHRALP